MPDRPRSRDIPSHARILRARCPCRHDSCSDIDYGLTHRRVTIDELSQLIDSDFTVDPTGLVSYPALRERLLDQQWDENSNPLSGFRWLCAKAEAFVVFSPGRSCFDERDEQGRLIARWCFYDMSESVGGEGELGGTCDGQGHHFYWNRETCKWPAQGSFYETRTEPAMQARSGLGGEPGDSKCLQVVATAYTSMYDYLGKPASHLTRATDTVDVCPEG